MRRQSSWARMVVFMWALSANLMANPSVVLKTPKEVKEVFESTQAVTRDGGIVSRPALVSERLYSRFLSLPKTDARNADADYVANHYALTRQGVGRYFAFVSDHTLIEKALVYGQFNPSAIMEDLGYGPGQACMENQFYWLVVWQPKSKPVPATYQGNLQTWLKHVYGNSIAPHLSGDAIDQLVNQRFPELTGCPVDPVTGVFDYKNAANCSNPAFSRTLVELNAQYPFSCSAANSIRYSKNNGCPLDADLLDLSRQPSAGALRAWLFEQSFFEFYTGYGYSADFYNEPTNREYWVDNEWIRNLPRVQLLSINCQKQAQISQTPKSADVPHLSRPRSPLIEIYR